MVNVELRMEGVFHGATFDILNYNEDVLTHKETNDPDYVSVTG